MESVWDYIMRRKPVFLGYFALFLVSVFTSFGFMYSLMPKQTVDEPSIVQEKPQYYDLVLSPQAVASLSDETTTNEVAISGSQPDLVYVELADPSSTPNPETPNPEVPSPEALNPEASNPEVSNLEGSIIPEPVANSEITANPETSTNFEQSAEATDGRQLATADQTVDVPLTNAPESTTVSPRKVSIFRTILAVLLAVTALTLAGFGLYQAYDYFAPFIDDYLQRNYH